MGQCSQHVIEIVQQRIEATPGACLCDLQCSESGVQISLSYDPRRAQYECTCNIPEIIEGKPVKVIRRDLMHLI